MAEQVFYNRLTIRVMLSDEDRPLEANALLLQ